MDYKTEIVVIDEREYTLLIGTNAKSNETIIKISEPLDLWFHLEGVSSPHIILQTDGDNLCKRALRQVAAKLFEHKKNAPKKTNVIYTEVKNVKLTSTLGSVFTRKTSIIKFQ